jgi:hypothetical protein
MINLRFKQDKYLLVDGIICMLNMNITQNTTKMFENFKNYQIVMRLNSATSKFVYDSFFEKY